MTTIVTEQQEQPLVGFCITTRIDGDVVSWMRPISDPFVRHQVVVETWPIKRLPWFMRRKTYVEISVDADKKTMQGVFQVLATPPEQRGIQGESGPQAAG